MFVKFVDQKFAWTVEDASFKKDATSVSGLRLRKGGEKTKFWAPLSSVVMIEEGPDVSEDDEVPA